MLDSLGCDFPSITFCKAEFVDMNCLNLFLSWNILFSPLIVNDSLAGYSSLGLHPWFLQYLYPGSSGFHGFHREVRCKSDMFTFISYLTFATLNIFL